MKDDADAAGQHLSLALILKNPNIHKGPIKKKQERKVVSLFHK
jgi:hypothetical protein